MLKLVLTASSKSGSYMVLFCELYFLFLQYLLFFFFSVVDMHCRESGICSCLLKSAIFCKSMQLKNMQFFQSHVMWTREFPQEKSHKWGSYPECFYSFGVNSLYFVLVFVAPQLL